MPWQRNSILIIILYPFISLQMPVITDLLAFSYFLFLLLSTHIYINLRKLPGKWCSNWHTKTLFDTFDNNAQHAANANLQLFFSFGTLAAYLMLICHSQPASIILSFSLSHNSQQKITPKVSLPEVIVSLNHFNYILFHQLLSFCLVHFFSHLLPLF